MKATRVTIVGLGLMGGSIALALRPHIRHMTVVDTDPFALRAAISLADEVTGDFESGVSAADLIILATPVRTILHLLSVLPKLRRDGCELIDLGSTKQAVDEAMNALPPAFQAIGGHPICGKESAGFSSASPDLFHDRTFVLCRNNRTGPEVEETALEIVEAIGSKALFLTPSSHDDLLATSSHLPYLTAAALMKLSALGKDETVWNVSATGFKDATRLSGSTPSMMLDILATNRAAILDRLEAYVGQLEAVAEMMRSEDQKSLLEWLDEARSQHEAYLKSVTGG